eukprot:m.232836 g.232836  ORF g.232836 m.232836 type:complete len:162 (+) comp15238_c1_seq5:2244-2729(+)
MLPLYTLEILAKIYAWGFRNFVRNKANVFDFLIIGAAVVIAVVEVFRDLNARSLVDFVLVLRVLRLVTVIGHIERFRLILQTLSQLTPVLAVYSAMVVLLFYVYAITGMELFANKIYEVMTLFYNTSCDDLCALATLHPRRLLTTAFFSDSILHVPERQLV